MFPRFDSGDRQQRIDQSGAFKARTGRQILGRWREPPVDQNNEQKGPEGRQNKTICRPFRPGCDFFKKISHSGALRLPAEVLPGFQP